MTHRPAHESRPVPGGFRSAWIRDGQVVAERPELVVFDGELLVWAMREVSIELWSCGCSAAPSCCEANENYQPEAPPECRYQRQAEEAALVSLETGELVRHWEAPQPWGWAEAEWSLELLGGVGGTVLVQETSLGRRCDEEFETGGPFPSVEFHGVGGEWVKGAIFRRYPGVSIYMAEATWSNSQRVPKLVSGVEVHKFPVFTGKAGRDARFFGFRVSTEDARGDALPENPLNTAGLVGGWFFVLEEPPSQPRFGLDDGPAPAFSQLTTWSDLGWESVGVPDGGFVDLAAVAGTEPGPLDGGITWGQSAAHMARITLQKPARVLFHASGLLPPA